MPTGIQQALDIQCVGCSDILTEDNTNEAFNNMCEDCYDSNIGYCDDCGTAGVYSHQGWRECARISRALHIASEIHALDDGTVCAGCASSCEECGSLYAYADNAFDCCPTSQDGELHYYSFKPAPKFWDTGTKFHWRPTLGQLYMGIELEVEKVSHIAYDFTMDAGEDWHDPNFFYWKSDGSLGSYGAELVTHPATIVAFMEKFPFGMMADLRQAGARSYAYGSTGFHIHVSRTAFSPSHLWKFVKLQARSATELQRFAGRSSCHWASWTNESMAEIASQTAKFAKGDRSCDRYVAINFRPDETIELRYFKGNILPYAIKRNVELVHAMYTYTGLITIPQAIASNAISWGAFVEWLNDNNSDMYQNAINYINNIVTPEFNDDQASIMLEEAPF